MNPASSKRNSALYRIYIAALGVAAAVAVVGGVFATSGRHRPLGGYRRLAPQHAGEPSVTGTTRVGLRSSARRADVDGHGADHVPRSGWFRCDGAGAPDASGRGRISNAAANSYTLRQADAGFRHSAARSSRATSDGSARATSNPTNVVDLAASGRTRRSRPFPGHGQGRQHAAGQPWQASGAGRQPITDSIQPGPRLQRARATTAARSRAPPDTPYGSRRDADTGRTIRARVSARNANRGSSSAISNQTGVVGGGTPPLPTTA